MRLIRENVERIAIQRHDRKIKSRQVSGNGTFCGWVKSVCFWCESGYNDGKPVESTGERERLGRLFKPYERRALDGSEGSGLSD